MTPDQIRKAVDAVFAALEQRLMGQGRLILLLIVQTVHSMIDSALVQQVAQSMK